MKKDRLTLRPAGGWTLQSAQLRSKAPCAGHMHAPCQSCKRQLAGAVCKPSLQLNPEKHWQGLLSALQLPRTAATACTPPVIPAHLSSPCTKISQSHIKAEIKLRVPQMLTIFCSLEGPLARSTLAWSSQVYLPCFEAQRTSPESLSMCVDYTQNHRHTFLWTKTGAHFKSPCPQHNGLVFQCVLDCPEAVPDSILDLRQGVV